MEQFTTWKTEDLLQHHGWARSLARHLVADEATADDVVQESMMRALERAPRGIEDARTQRSWLGTVVRNVVRQRGRAEGRRARREREAAPEEALPSALDMTTFAEGQKLLLGALLTLDEDSRHLVLLRYHEGLSSAEIARRSDRNAGTIRSKLKRALDQLRGELDRKHGGDRSAWHAAVAPLVVFAPARSAAVAAGASHVLPAGVKWTAALAFVFFAAFTLFQLVTPGSFFDRRAEPPTLTPAEVATRLGTQAADATSEGRDALVAAPEADGGDARMALAEAKVSAEPATTEVAPIKTGAIRVRLVDEEGRPIEGVEVSARSSETVKSGADGRAEIEVFLGRPTYNAWVNFRHFGHASDQGQFEGVRGETVDVGDVVLRAGGDIRGRVVNRDGAPVSGLTVSTEGLARRTSSGGGIVSMTSTMIGRTHETTDEEGRFHLRGALAGEVDVEVRSDDKVWTGDALSVAVAAGEVVKGLVITVDEVPRETRIEGVVLDHEGAPVPYASLNLSWSTFFSNSSMSRSADGQGRFVVIVPEDVEVQMSFSAPGGNIAGAVRRDVKGGTLDMVVQLAPPRSFRVLVAGRDGQPVEGATVGLTVERSIGAREETDSNGLAELPRPLDEFTLAVRADGFADFDEDYSALPEEESGPVTLPVELEPIPQLVGRILANGRPVEGASLSVRRVARNRVEIAGLPSLVHDHLEAASSSDEGGAFALTL